MAGPVEIRRATGDDAAAIAACLDHAFDAYRHHYPREGYRDSVPDVDGVRRRLQSMTLFVATAAGQIVGTISCDVSATGEGHLRGMAVLPDWQGRGVASPLLRAAEGHLAECGCVKVTLDTTAPLERAIGFYEREGYRSSGRVGDFFGMPLFEYVKEI